MQVTGIKSLKHPHTSVFFLLVKFTFDGWVMKKMPLIAQNYWAYFKFVL